MGALRRYLPLFFSTGISLFFLACGGGGDDGAQPISPDNSGSELQRISAEMQKAMEEHLGAQVDATLAAASSDSFDLTFIQLLLSQGKRSMDSWVPQKLNQWSGYCARPDAQAQTGMTPSACVNSFWHTLAAIGMGTVVSPLAALPPGAQAAALATALQFAQNNQGVPGNWIASGQSYLGSLGF